MGQGIACILSDDATSIVLLAGGNKDTRARDITQAIMLASEL